MSVLEKKHSVAPMKTAKRLESGRFGLPNKPSETPEQLEELVRCGDWGRAAALPLAPYPWGNPSVRLDAGQLP